MAPWIKTETTIRTDGDKIIRYESFRNPNAIESRRVALPHAGDLSGYWYHTSYFLIRPDGTEKEFQTLAAAKEAAEKES